MCGYYNLCELEGLEDLDHVLENLDHVLEDLDPVLENLDHFMRFL